MLSSRFACGVVASTALFAAPAAGQVTTRISLAFDGGQAEGGSYSPSISADGLHVAFESESTDLVPGGTNGWRQIYVRDLATGVTERVSVSSSELEGNSLSYGPRISTDGRFVAFTSYASNLIPHGPTGVAEVYVRDRLLGTTEIASLSSTSVYCDAKAYCADMSPDGNFVVFHTESDYMVPGDIGSDGDVFVRDRARGITDRVSVSTAGAEGNGSSGYSATISADGRFVAFTSAASNLAPDTNSSSDVFLRDRLAGTTELISVNDLGQQVNSGSSLPDMSADGRYVAFSSYELIDMGQPLGLEEIYVRDLVAGTTELASVDSNGVFLPMDMFICTLSADGRYVVLDGHLDGQPTRLRDRVAGTTQVVGMSTDGTVAVTASGQQAISDDDRFVVFSSSASDLVPGDTNGASDVFLRDTRPFFADLGQGLAGVAGVPSLTGSGVLLGGEPVAFALANAKPSAVSALVISPFLLNAPFKGGTLVPMPDRLVNFTTSPAGTASLPVVWPAGLPSDLVLYLQWWIQDPAGPVGFSASNGLSVTTP